MKTIKELISSELVIKNSKFITIIEPLNNVEDLDNIMNDIKAKHKNATHYCYAYIINDIKHCSDDGEPSGTAGAPILNVLKKNNLTDILCVVIRYFGGIKLGAGGLIRAYGKSVTETLKLAQQFDVKITYIIKIKFDYNDRKVIDSILHDKLITNKVFDEDITYEFQIDENTDYITNTLEKNGAKILYVKKVVS